MKTSKCNLSIACLIALVAIIFALPGQLPGQTGAAKSSGGNGLPPHAGVFKSTRLTLGSWTSPIRSKSRFTRISWRN